MVTTTDGIPQLRNAPQPSAAAVVIEGQPRARGHIDYTTSYGTTLVPYDSHVNSILLRHEIIGMRYLMSVWHVILASIASTLAEGLRAKYSTRQFCENF